MGTTRHPVPALRLRRSPNLAAKTFDFLQVRDLTIEDLLRDPMQQSIVIPIGKTFENGFTIECLVNTGPPASADRERGPIQLWTRTRASGEWLMLHFAPEYLDAPDVWHQLSIEYSPGAIPSTSAKTTVNTRTPALKSYPEFDHLWAHPVRIDALIISSEIWPEFMVSELRIWDRTFPRLVAHWVDLFRFARCDGRESGLIGYWKLAEGQGTRIGDSSGLAKAGVLTDGQWVSASESGLILECALEELRERRAEWNRKKSERRRLEQTNTELAQQKERLTARIEQLRIEQHEQEARLQKFADIEALLRKENADYEAWRRDIEDEGKVALDEFNRSLAQEIDEASQHLDENKSPYRLQGVSLEVKLLPIRTEAADGKDDFRVTFPALDDPVPPEHLSTLWLNFETRTPELDKPEEVVPPDVRGYTELAARRKLGAAGFRVEVIEQAVARDEDVGRVVAQIPTPDGKLTLNEIVAIVLGRASGAG